MSVTRSRLNTTKNDSNTQAAQMRFLRRVKGFKGRNVISNEDVQSDLRAFAINEKIVGYKEK